MLGKPHPHEVAFGETPDISALVQHQFFDRVLFLDPTASFPADKERAGRYLGVTESFGDSLTYYIWSEEAKQVIVRSVVRPYDNSEDSPAPNFHAERGFEIHESHTDTDLSESDNPDTTDFDADSGT